jgi:hypothetical protein
MTSMMVLCTLWEGISIIRRKPQVAILIPVNAEQEIRDKCHKR